MTHCHTAARRQRQAAKLELGAAAAAVTADAAAAAVTADAAVAVNPRDGAGQRCKLN